MSSTNTVLNQALMVPDHPMYSETFDHPSAIVQAAFEVANNAHAHDVRKRKIGTFPYITHPIMVCKLLQKLGRDDEINLAVGLLHDVLEDNEEYKANPETMCLRLKLAMVNRGMSEDAADEMAHKIYSYCIELCNPKNMIEGKRVYQVDHVSKLSKRAKLIKMLDQTASVLEDIWYEGIRDHKKLERFAFKGLNIAKSAETGGDEAHLMAYQFYKIVFRYFANIAEKERQSENTHIDPNIAAQLQLDIEHDRQSFDVDRAMVQAREDMEADIREALYDRLRRGSRPEYVAHEEEIITIKHPMLAEDANARLKFGCTSVDVIQDQDGPKVCGYTIAIASRADEGEPANMASMSLMTEIESFATRQRITIHDSEVMGTGLVRRFSIKPAMKLDDFISKASRASAEIRYELAERGEVPEFSYTKERVNILDYRMSLALEETRLGVDRNRVSAA